MTWHGILQARVTGVGCRTLLQGMLLTQGSNPRLLNWQADSLPVAPPIYTYLRSLCCNRKFTPQSMSVTPLWIWGKGTSPVFHWLRLLSSAEGRRGLSLDGELRSPMLQGTAKKINKANWRKKSHTSFSPAGPPPWLNSWTPVCHMHAQISWWG